MGVLLCDPEPETRKPLLIKVTPESVFNLLARRRANGADVNLDHEELFNRGGLILYTPEQSLLIYSIDQTAFFARVTSRHTLGLLSLAEAPVKTR